MPSTRTFRLSVAWVAVLALSGGATALLTAQSLADVARKEEERRKANPQPAKVYTNKDLLKAGPPSTPSAADAPKDAGADSKESKPAGDSTAEDKPPTKGQAYWANKQKELRTKLEQDQSYSSAMQSQINALTTQFTNEDDPVRRSKVEQSRQKALGDLARLTKAIADDQKALSAFLEEARTSGIPPGWLR